jgi:hypothetical protein
VLAFNYGFESPRGSREESTLLVEDPEIAPAAAVLEPNRLNGSSIIRDHLARQCMLFGASALAPHVRMGLSLDGVSNLPPVYQIDHPRLSNRRYIGQWFAASHSGELLAVPSPLGGRGWRLIERGPYSFLARGPRGLVEVYVHHDDPTGAFGRSLFESLVSGVGAVFVGQDALMLRRCTQVARDRPLDGEPFEDELNFVYTSGDGPYVKTIRLLSNGSIVATNGSADLGDSAFWHQ